MTDELLYPDLTYRVRGLAFKVHGALKGGHPERVYEEALCGALDRDGIAYRRQPQIHVCYKGKQVGEYYPDLLLADGKVLLELKATPAILPLHKAQTLSYLAAAQAELGLLLNFGAPSMQIERLPNFVANRKPFIWNPTPAPDLLYPETTDAVLSALHEIHHELGPGFLSQIYRRAVRIEFLLRQMNVEYLKQLPIRFETQQIDVAPVRLFLVEQRLLVAVAALSETTAPHTEKMRWAMQETGCQLGLIANFHPGKLRVTFLRTSA